MTQGYVVSLMLLMGGAAAVLAQTPATVQSVPHVEHVGPLEAPPTVHEPVIHEVEEPPHIPHFWVRAEYLLWSIRDSSFPALLTTGSPAAARPGALGMPVTQVLFGGEADNHERSGGRFFAGLWLDEPRMLGFEAGYFFLGTREASESATSSGGVGSPIVARPFFDALAGREDSSLVAFPLLAGGAVNIEAGSRLQGFEANGLVNLGRNEHWTLDALVGFRYLGLDEDLLVSEFSNISAASPLLPSTQVSVSDSFDTRSRFYGGQLGVRAGWHSERWSVNAVGKVALGSSCLDVDVAGATTIAPAGQAATQIGSGLLAVASNRGRRSDNAFAVAPEVGVQVRFHVLECLHVFAGYTFLYWSEVARPGDQVDRTINVAQVPTSQFFGTPGGPARPAAQLNSTDFWAHGVNFGLEFRY